MQYQPLNLGSQSNLRRVWRQRLTSGLTTIAALAGVALTLGASADHATLQDPETELAVAKTDLGNLERRLTAAHSMADRLGLGPQTAAADRSWKNAQNFFGEREWLSAVRELNNYLNQTQVPETQSYLKSQYMLGRSYEELGYKAKSLRAYFRYLASFLTAKQGDHPELLEVLRRMIPLAADSKSQSQLNELLASITSLNLPPDVQPVVYYFAAKAAANTGESTLASGWITRAETAPNDPVLKAKALYLRALIALGKKDYDAAEEDLAQVALADKEGATRGLARLALARIAVHQHKRETALKYYALITEDSSAYKDAIFESIYVHLDLKQDSDARAKAQLYLARWAEGPDALQLRMLLAYLDMRAGDLTSAARSIATADTRLHEINSWVGTNLSGKNAVSQTTLSNLMEMTGGQLPVAPSVREASELFGRLAETGRHLADVRGEIRNISFTIGRANIEHLRPYWVNRAEQLALIGDELLKVGHRLAATERNLYSNRLSAVDRQKLQSSETRRTRLLSAAADSHRKLTYWASYANTADLTRSVANSYDKLQKTTAEMAAARYRVATAEGKNKEHAQDRLAELETKASQLSATAAKALGVLRTSRVEDLLSESPHRAVAKFLAQYAAALHEEAEIVRRARDEALSPGERLNAEDGAAAWEKWEFLAKDVFGQLTELDHEIASGLTGILKELESEETRYSELQAKLKALTTELEGRLGMSLSYIVDQYQNAISSRFARHEKWKADIDWLTYQTKVDEEHKLNDRNALEQQMLLDNLTDLQQGAMWQWPK